MMRLLLLIVMVLGAVLVVAAQAEPPTVGDCPVFPPGVRVIADRSNP